jgi:CDP-4-dehydro-6-deoxyglucose reductase
MKSTEAKLLKITPLTNTIVLVELEPEEYIPYRAGQYLQLKAGDRQGYFSIANAPLGTQKYELHIRHDQTNLFSQDVLKHLQNYGKVNLNLPMGKSHIGYLERTKPIIFIAGGTGFAQIKGVIEQLLYTDDGRTFECYWGAKEQSDLYWQNRLHEWQTHVKTFEYLALFEGKKSYGMIDAIFSRHSKNIKEFQFMISGPFEMVYACRDQLLALGISVESIHSDAFEFEDKEKKS